MVGLHAAVTQHLDELRRRGRRKGTINQRRLALARLERYAAPTDLLAVTLDQLRSWVFDSRDLQPEAQATEISHARQFYAWTVDVGLLEIDPSARLHRPALPYRLPRPMSAGDLAVAIDMAPDRIRPWLLLAAYAGLRCHEIAQLRADDLWTDQEPRLIIIVDGKGGSSSSVAMREHLHDELVACDLPRRGWLFTRRDGNPGPVPPHVVSQLSNAYLHSVGITDTIHQARHWFGTEALRAAGGNVRVAQEALRHRSIASTQRYTFVAPTEVAAAVARMPVLSTHPRLPFTTS